MRTLSALALLLAAAPAAAQEVVFNERFEGGLEAWEVVRLDRRSTDYATTMTGNERVLVATSRNAAAALVHPVETGAPERAVLEWRWRVAESYTENDRERERRGDDFVARVFVTFGDDPFERGTRALCYVWAGQEEPGAQFENPVVSDVVTFVVRSGDSYAGRWMREQRDVVADYRTAFGEAPPAISGLAVMADSDDTSSSSISWFDDIRLSVVSSP